MPRYKPRKPIPTSDARSADERLESLVREPNLDRAHRMFARILTDLDASPDPAKWIAAARTLSERLILSEDTFYYFVVKFTECLVMQASANDPELVRLSSEMQAIERAGGLAEDDSYTLDEAPPEWLALNDAWDERADYLVVEYLRTHGHADVASLMADDFEEFDARSSAGQDQLWGEDMG